MQGGCLSGTQGWQAGHRGQPWACRITSHPWPWQEGQFGYREFKRTQASAQRSRDEVPAHLSQPLSGPQALRPRTSLHLVQFEFLKNSLQKIKSCIIDVPASQSAPSFSGPHCPRPTWAQQLPAAGHLQAWCPPSGYTVPLEAVAGKELPGRAALGVTFLVLWGYGSLQHARPKEALMDQ